MFYKKGVLRNFTKFTGKHLYLFLIKLPATLLKKTLAQVFSCEFCGIFKNTFFTEHLWWLLLIIYEIIAKVLSFWFSNTFLLFQRKFYRKSCWINEGCCIDPFYKSIKQFREKELLNANFKKYYVALKLSW